MSTTTTTFQDIPNDIVKQIMLRMTLPCISKFIRTNTSHFRLFTIQLFNLQNQSSCLTWSEVATLGCQIINKPFWKPVFIHNRALKNLNRRRSFKNVGTNLKLTGQRPLLYSSIRTYPITRILNVFRFRISSWVQQVELGCWDLKKKLPAGRHHIHKSYIVNGGYTESKIGIYPSRDTCNIPEKLMDTAVYCLDCKLREIQEQFGMTKSDPDPGHKCQTRFIMRPEHVYQLRANFETNELELLINDVFVCSTYCDLNQKLYFFGTFDGNTVVEAV